MARLGRVIIDHKSGQRAIIQIIFSKEVVTPSWILKGCFAEALAQNRSQAFILTANNNIHVLDCHDDAASYVFNFSETRLCDGPRSFLYSGDLTFAPDNRIIATAGTVFGEILVWSCTRSAASEAQRAVLHCVFLGHHGSIFGVCISPSFEYGGKNRQLLASCSDDRTVRLWDISDSGGSQSNELATVERSLETGFGPQLETSVTQELTVSYGHLSRIWEVAFVEGPQSDKTARLCLITRGEDTACQLWSIKLEQLFSSANVGVGALAPTLVDRHHAGKNAWSLAQLTTSTEQFLFTGGADGRIVSRSYNVKSMSENVLVSWHSFKNIFELLRSSPGSDSVRMNAKAKAMKHYLLLGDDHILASTDQGDLLCGSLNAEDSISWSTLISAESGMSLSMCSTEAGDMAFVAQSTGNFYVVRLEDGKLKVCSTTLNMSIAWMQTAQQDNAGQGIACRACIVAAIVGEKQYKVLWVTLKSEELRVSLSDLELPDTFGVTAVIYDSSARLLILGSRAGALAVYGVNNKGPIAYQLLHCLRHVHGSDSVTSIIAIGGNSFDTRSTDLYILTTGRDGSYAVHHLVNSESLVMAACKWTFVTIHSSAPPFGPYIEGAYISKSQKGTKELVLYGFRSKNFMVWNETLQTSVLSTDCGGAHRSWAYKPNFDHAGGAGRFVWTKAGNFYSYRRYKPDHDVISRGGHGREIKALAQSPKTYSIQERGLSKFRLLATGAEDTDIRLFAVAHPNETDKHELISIQTLRKHTTGLQHLQFSSCGHYLFSSAGFEEFFVWRLRADLPCLGIGVVLQDVLPRVEEDRDARILSFDVKDVDDSAQNRAFVIITAYSNGKANITRYAPSKVPMRGVFDIVDVLEYGTFCLTQAAITASGLGFHDLYLTAGTNGYINIHQSNLEAADRRMEIHRIHQSSVAALTSMMISRGINLIATGGDDNALGLTLVVAEDGKGPFFRTLLIPKAHAAALTALDVVDCRPGHGHVIVVTAGNDQKVKLWKLEGQVLNSADAAAFRAICSIQDVAQGLAVEKVGEAWSCVADVSAIQIVGATKKWIDVMVVGVGMELLRLLLEQ